MSNENNEKFEKLEKQIGTLKFVVLIMAAALIYNSAVKTGMLGDYRITANTLAIKTIIIKGNNNENNNENFISFYRFFVTNVLS